MSKGQGKEPTTILASRIIMADVSGSPGKPARSEEHELIARCLSSEALQANQAFETLVKRYQERVYAIAFRFFGNHDDATEVSQRVFIRVHQKLANFREESSLQTWLYQITLNLCKNFRRDESRHTGRSESLEDGERGDAAASVAPEGGTDDSERRALRAAINQLSPMQRSVVILRIYEELPFKEIAEIAKCSEASAKVNFHHALKHLQDRLGKRGAP